MRPALAAQTTFEAIIREYAKPPYSVSAVEMINAFNDFDFDDDGRSLLTEDERAVCNIATD